MEQRAACSLLVHTRFFWIRAAADIFLDTINPNIILYPHVMIDIKISKGFNREMFLDPCLNLLNPKVNPCLSLMNFSFIKYYYK
jgi:hypothetical protein